MVIVTPAWAQEDLNSLLEPIRAKYQLPALAAAVADEGKVIAIGAVGTRVLGQDIPVTLDDRFHLGSDTKAMTAVLAGKLVDEGRLAWSTTIGDVFGESMPGLNPGFAAITLEQLLSHTSGIPTDNEEIAALYFGNAYDDTPTNLRRKIISEWGSKHEPAPGDVGSFHYANLGYTIVGAMVEQVTGKPWENLIQSEIFAPLGLTTAGLGPQATTGLYDAPVGHAVGDDGQIEPRPWGPSADVPTVIGPAGSAHMSVRDFVTWAAWNAGGGKRGPSLVTPETLAMIHAPHVSMEIPDPPPGTPTSGQYGFGWGLVEFEWAPEPLLTHNGSNSMNLATVLIDPELDLAITVVTNFPGKGADSALREVMKVLYEGYSPSGAIP